MRSSLFLFFGLIISISLNAQLPSLGYAGNIGNTGTADSRGQCVAHDLSGNSYFAGTFGGTVDFDLSASVNSKSAIGGQDIFLAKYNSAGQLQWVNHVGAAGMDIAYGINVDIFGDIYITGMLTGSADFDPSPTNTFVVSTTSGGSDSFVAKYNSNGGFIFAFNIAGSPGNDYAQSITSDASGNFFITGFFAGTCNFNPFGSPFSLTVNGTLNSYLAKYNPSGNLQWAFNIQSPGKPNIGRGLCLDPSGNIFITGYFEGTTDFDPIGTLNKTSNGWEDIFIAKYANSNGALIWVNEIGSSTGNDEGFSVHSDASGNVFGTGFFQGSADFDPSATPIIKTSVGGLDAYVVKFDGAGNYQSAFQIGSSGQDCGTSLYTDNSSNVYVTGYYSGTANFAPSGPPQYQNCAGVSDMFIARYNNSLNSYQFGFNTNNFNKTMGMAIDVDGIGNIYSTGLLYGSGDFDPTATNSVVAAQANSPGNDIFIAKYIQCVMPSAPTNITSTVNLVVCSGNTATLSASTSSGTINWYSSPVSTLTLGSGSVFTSSALTTSTASPSTYSFYAGVTTCTYSPRILITVTVNPLPVVSITSKTLVCSNKPTLLIANGASSYLWSTGSTTYSTAPTPTANTVYSVTGTSTNNCSSTASFTITTTTVPTPDICQVTVDSLSVNNEIYWDKTLYPSADSFIVYREVSSNVYKRIAAINKSLLSMYVDTNRSIGPNNGNPNLTSYKYKLQIKDTCGNYSALSLWHQTIFIQDQLNGNFNWTPYAIESTTLTPVANYNLKRRNLSTGTETLVASTSSFLSSDPQYNTVWPTNIKWFVDAIGFSCNATAKVSVLKNKTKSNQSNDKQFIGINEYSFTNAIKVFPNPAADVINLDLNGIPKEETQIEITNAIGQIVYQTKSWNQYLVINTSTMQSGVYFVSIRQNNKAVAVKKVVVDK